jgi:hypothetical protein
MANDVWIFQTYSNGKISLVGTKPDSGVVAVAPSRDVTYQEHTLIVRTDTDLAERCRSCGCASLVRGELCEKISAYNDENTPVSK